MRRTTPDLCTTAVHALRRRAAELWRVEPSARENESRTDLLLRLHGVRLDLEALERRIDVGRVGPEDERALHLCATRLDQLAGDWYADRRQPQCA